MKESHVALACASETRGRAKTQNFILITSFLPKPNFPWKHFSLYSQKWNFHILPYLTKLPLQNLSNFSPLQYPPNKSPKFHNGHPLEHHTGERLFFSQCTAEAY
jgi:hypothetical protein